MKASGTYLSLQILLELLELSEKVCVNVLNLLNRVVINLTLEVFFGHFLPQRPCSIHSLQSFAFLDSTLIKVLLFDESEHEHIVE